MIEQGESDLKHIALLRKVIMERRSGIASFEGRDWAATIPFGNGVLLGGDVSEKLAHVLQGPVFRFDWVDSRGEHDDLAIPTLPRLAFSQAIASLDLRENRLMAYRTMFSSLPGITVRFTSTFRFNLEYQKMFQELYQMSMAAGGVRLSDYFAAAAGGVELRKRMNVAIALYCMGDMLPAVRRAVAPAAQAQPTQAASAAAPTDAVNVVSRILARLRG